MSDYVMPKSRVTKISDEPKNHILWRMTTS